ncbi:MAG: DUF3990 domain-containing protein [Bacteroidaceae bacterium]|nr:DUF3990 domain-containing protein [Bacteroidaceae bacterium]
MILYHGSNTTINDIDLNKCHLYKDFGQAFYLTEDKAQASVIANDRVGMQIRNFRMGFIDMKEFMRRLHYMKGITYQWAFCTEKAIKYLERI